MAVLTELTAPGQGSSTPASRAAAGAVPRPGGQMVTSSDPESDTSDPATDQSSDSLARSAAAGPGQRATAAAPATQALNSRVRLPMSVRLSAAPGSSHDSTHESGQESGQDSAQESTHDSAQESAEESGQTSAHNSSQDSTHGSPTASDSDSKGTASGGSLTYVTPDEYMRRHVHPRPARARSSHRRRSREVSFSSESPELYFQSGRKYTHRSYGGLCLSMSIVAVIVAVIGIVSVAAYLGDEMQYAGQFRVLHGDVYRPELEDARSDDFKHKAARYQRMLETLYGASSVSEAFRHVDVHSFDGRPLTVFFRIHLDRRKIPRSVVDTEEALRDVLTQEVMALQPKAFRALQLDINSIHISRAGVVPSAGGDRARPAAGAGSRPAPPEIVPFVDRPSSPINWEQDFLQMLSEFVLARTKPTVLSRTEPNEQLVTGQSQAVTEQSQPVTEQPEPETELPDPETEQLEPEPEQPGPSDTSDQMDTEEPATLPPLTVVLKPAPAKMIKYDEGATVDDILDRIFETRREFESSKENEVGSSDEAAKAVTESSSSELWKNPEADRTEWQGSEKMELWSPVKENVQWTGEEHSAIDQKWRPVRFRLPTDSDWPRVTEPPRLADKLSRLTTTPEPPLEVVGVSARPAPAAASTQLVVETDNEVGTAAHPSAVVPTRPTLASLLSNYTYPEEELTPPGAGCPGDQFRCVSGECIPRLSRCDLLRDCADGSDEMVCTCADRLNAQFLERKICDGIIDCHDSTDEQFCDWCQPGQFICPGAKRCVPAETVCDGEYDCPDGADEHHETTGVFRTDSAPSAARRRSRRQRERRDDPFYRLVLSEDAPRNTSGQIFYRHTSVSDYSTSLVFEEATCPRQTAVHISCDSLKCGLRPRVKQRRARIVGGTNSSPGAWPWQAAMYRDGEYQCGATLISDRWLLSAGHCYLRSATNHWVARLGAYRRGSTLLSPFESLHQVSHIIVHPDYEDVGYVNDIALLRLADSVSMSDFVRPVCLPPRRNEVTEGAICSVIGWGQLFESGRIFPDTLQEVELPLITSQQCKKRTSRLPLYKITDDMFCAGYDRGGRDACLGDSGGPLMCQEPSGEWTLTGITSNGYGCARALRPGVYTKVANYVDWIERVTTGPLPRARRTRCRGHSGSAARRLGVGPELAGYVANTVGGVVGTIGDGNSVGPVPLLEEQYQQLLNRTGTRHSGRVRRALARL
ncbi:Atrial natriuretic peptide-converting enzyme [Amphibalanus amphitrite]|uniref:Atrial natriuretic peptide-converting enzyme n=1 Tax=Amphibalanus amphitrite TaxID=1232801 RepID=A0A6A4X208_AMPAM|nr:Atrial natriuretic peptide-converting enzyme [Amphibalanus amphitrite]